MSRVRVEIGSEEGAGGWKTWAQLVLRGGKKGRKETLRAKRRLWVDGRRSADGGRRSWRDLREVTKEVEGRSSWEKENRKKRSEGARSGEREV
ncbi:hypothetical protein KM043_006535 [Ampulex compressa]|nr:hypothetical protein KM043_006535 [Ampulex compressa]